MAPRINEFVLGRGLAGGRFSPVGVVRHRGRRSGRMFVAPVAVHRRNARYLLPLTYGPATEWCRNVVAAQGCVLMLHGQQIALVEPVLVGRGSLGRGWQMFYRLTGHREFLSLRPQTARKVG